MTDGPLLKLVGLTRPRAIPVAHECGYKLSQRDSDLDPATARVGLSPGVVHAVTAGRPLTVAAVYVCRPMTEAERRLAAEWTGLVRFVYDRHMDRLNEAFRDEVLPEGFVGLVTAAMRYDPTIGVLFKTFAYSHIIGVLRKTFERVRAEHARRQLAVEQYKALLARTEGAYTDPVPEPWGRPSLVDLIHRALPDGFSPRDLEILDARWGYDDEPEPGRVVGARYRLTRRAVTAIETEARLRLAGPVDRLLRR